MNILEKLPESKSAPGEIDKAGFLKVLREAIIAGLAALVGSLLLLLPGFDFMPNSAIDNVVITVILIPGLETLRRLFADYSKPNTEN